MLGSFPSVASLRKREYYGHPQNWFWRVLEACGVIPDAGASYAERVATLTGRGLAVWDLYARAAREGSGDDRIEEAAPNDLHALWAERGPFPILLNGRRDREWRRLFAAIPASTTALPSTSPRPLHWNTAESRAAAIQEWCGALSAALGTRPRGG